MIHTLELTDIYRPVQAELDRFKIAIRDDLRSDDPFLNSINEYLLQLSGKHLRPALAILSSRLSGNTTDTPIRLAIAIELLHTATLIHDDIIDESMFRRNQLTLNAKWGNEVSIIAGDYLYAKAFSILASFQDPLLNAAFSQCARTMCEGEMKQVEKRKDLFIGEDAYLTIILKKTASLFQAACAAGGYFSHPQDRGRIEALNEYGKNLGMAFQITDDCLDITGKEEQLGKNPGLDIQKNDATLPLIYYAETLDRDSQREFFALLTSPSENGRRETFEKIKSQITASGVLDKCMERAQHYAGAAHEAVRRLPESVYRKSLSDLVDYTIQRVV